MIAVLEQLSRSAISRFSRSCWLKDAWISLEDQPEFALDPRHTNARTESFT